MRSRRALIVIVVVALGASVWVANASTVGRPQGCYADCADGARQAGPLRVMSMNVLHGFPTFAHLEQRLDLVADEMARRRVDVALLQEAPWAPPVGFGAERIAARVGLNHAFLRANGNRFAILFEEGSAILSRFPLRDVAWTELMPAAGPFEHRIALAATAETPWGDVRLVVTHLAGSSEDVNRGQSSALAGWVGATDAPLIVAGDFNADPASASYLGLPAAWTDAYRSVHPDDPGFTCCLNDLRGPPEGGGMRERVDHIFVAGGVDVSAAELVLLDALRVSDGWLHASDHAGVYVELDVAGAR